MKKTGIVKTESCYKMSDITQKIKSGFMKGVSTFLLFTTLIATPLSLASCQSNSNTIDNDIKIEQTADAQNKEEQKEEKPMKNPGVGLYVDVEFVWGKGATKSVFDKDEVDYDLVHDIVWDTLFTNEHLNSDRRDYTTMDTLYSFSDGNKKLNIIAILKDRNSYNREIVHLSADVKVLNCKLHASFIKDETLKVIDARYTKQEELDDIIRTYLGNDFYRVGDFTYVGEKISQDDYLPWKTENPNTSLDDVNEYVDSLLHEALNKWSEDFDGVAYNVDTSKREVRICTLEKTDDNAIANTYSFDYKNFLELKGVTCKQLSQEKYNEKSFLEFCQRNLGKNCIVCQDGLGIEVESEIQ